MNGFEISRHTGSAGCEVAVVGMACRFPGAPDVETFWRNIVRKIDSVCEVPRDRWNPDRFYDPQATDGTRLYGKRGGYLDSPFAFDPAEFGIMPKAVEGGEPDQFLVLKTAADALADAGLVPGDQGHEKTAFILGRGSYLSAGAFNLVQRTFIVDQTVDLVARMHPGFSDADASRLRQDLMESLKPFEAETAPSVMPNITAGRVANRLGFMGPNYTIDAACASSLYAVDAAVAALVSGRSDLALAGGVHIFNNIPFLNVFCTLGAMSRQEQIRPFDEHADGMIPGEGVGIIVLKRLADARRDEDQIYAVIRGVGSSSDGKGTSVAAPRVEGEVLALQRAYAAGGIPTSTISLIEAHGTATAVGDAAEIEALTTVFGKKGDDIPRRCALGTIKSMIGHAMPAAGIAGMIKTVLALYHKVLPPTLHCDNPNPRFKLAQTPFYINTETRPWFRSAAGIPRRAGLNAFGFGGVNAHVVIEEYPPEPSVDSDGAAAMAIQEHLDPCRRPSHSCPVEWDAALFLLTAGSRPGLAGRCRQLRAQIPKEETGGLTPLAHRVLSDYAPDSEQLAIVADSVTDLAGKLDYAAGRLDKKNCRKIKDVKGIYYFSEPLADAGRIAFMFPGEGSSYPGMMMDLCLRFPSVRAAFDEINCAIAARQHKPRYLPTDFVFPATLLTESENRDLTAEFWKVDSGLQAILASSLAMKDLLESFRVTPDMVVGHSAGEYSAWIASGILDKADLYSNQEQIAAVYADRPHGPETAMTAVSAGYEKVAGVVEQISGQIHISNDNCPHQVVVVGETDAMAQFREILEKERIFCTDLPSKEVHHTPMARQQANELCRAFSALQIHPPRIPAYSAAVSAPYPETSEAILQLMVRYWTETLHFRRTVEAMYDNGARIFIEVGPGSNLAGFVDDTLRGRNFMTMVSNTSRRSGTAQLCHLLGMLAAQHVPVSLAPLLEAQQADADTSADNAGLSDKQRKQGLAIQMDLGLPELQLSEAAQSRWRDKLAQRPTGEPGPASADNFRARPERLSYGSWSQPVHESKSESKERVSARSHAMTRYMDTMSRFLSLQKEITGKVAGLDNNGNRPRSQNSPAHPFVGRILSFSPRKEVRLERCFDLSEDVFLLDHPFGGEVSDADGGLYPLIVTPLTLNMEMMTEAAALLFPEKVPVEIRNVKAGRWVVVDEKNGVSMEATARAKSDREAVVRLCEQGTENFPSAQAEVVFEKAYPPPVPVDPIPDTGLSQEAFETARQIYEQKWMTHGPRFQVITGVPRAMENEIIALLRTPAHRNLFASGPKGALLLQPLLLDACAQLTGYWAQQSLKERFITFPAGVGSLRFYSSPPGPGQTMRARMRISEVTEHFVRSGIDIMYPGGRLWVHVTGWNHLRFDLPMELYHCWRFPRVHPVSRLVHKEEETGSGAVLCRAPYYEELEHTIWQKAIGWLYLNRAEREAYQRKAAAENNGTRWLAERIAAKDAVRIFTSHSGGGRLLPADIEIIENENGRWIPVSKTAAWPDRNLALSIAREESFVSAQLRAQQKQAERR